MDLTFRSAIFTGSMAARQLQVFLNKCGHRLDFQCLVFHVLSVSFMLKSSTVLSVSNVANLPYIRVLFQFCLMTEVFFSPKTV